MSEHAWLHGLRQRAHEAPWRVREPWYINGCVCGSIEPELAERIAAAGLPMRRSEARWCLTGPPDPALAVIARWMHDHGIGGRWRGELLAVTGTGDDVPRAVIERAAVRPLGITTRAAHLVAVTPAGSVWVQRRALDKAVDPGMLDTLVGGLVAAGESITQTLERETWEEAGLRLDTLHDLVATDRLAVQRPVSDGYMVEHLWLFEAGIPDGVVPVNQDGEVMAFDRLTPERLASALRAEEFTLEAALMHARWLERHGLI